jgi:dynein heavy chain
MNIIITLTKKTLQGLELAIAGTVIMTPDLANCGDCLFDAKVPEAWLKKSWVSPTLGLWFGLGLCNRTDELITWLEGGRPKSFWMTGYFNAQGFLTAVQQEVTRRHNGWSLDDIQIYTEVTPLEKEEAERKDRLEEGVYVWGLFLEAAAWDKKKNSLVDAPPKKLFCPIPCLFVTAIKKGEKKLGADYSCPCYTIPKRTGLYYVFNANIKTEQPPATWVLRGTALLCSKD